MATWKSRKNLKYEDLVEARVVAAAQKTILFDPKICSLEEWLHKNKPSLINRKDGIGWIAVESKYNERDTPDIEGSQKEWEDMIKSNKKITYNAIETIAKKYNNTEGKWMMSIITGNPVNKVWNLIAHNIVNGELGKLCYFVSVSPYESNFENSEHGINIYNRDFTNYIEVEMIEKELRKIGINDRLLYKPSIYTQIGIYPKNPWNIIPSIYESRYNPMISKSEIKKRPFKDLNEGLNSITIKATKFEADFKFCREKFEKL